MRRSDFAILFVLFVMLSAAAGSIIAAEWAPGLEVILWPMALGLLAGMALSFSHFPGWTAHLTSFVYASFVLAIIGGSGPGIPQHLDWRERLYLMTAKVIAWLVQAFNNGTSRDSLIFILILCSLFWLLGYTAAWYSFRHRRIWHVVLPAGVTLFSNVYYYGGVTPMGAFLGVYLVCALLLLALSHVADREEDWRRDGVRFARGLRGPFVAAGLSIGLIALFTGWRAPVLAASSQAQDVLNQLSEPYNDLRARLNRLFSEVRNYSLQPVNSYGNSLTLSGPRNLTEDPVMDVVALPNRYYWRATSFDFYDGATWVNTETATQESDPREPSLLSAQYSDRMSVSAGFTLHRGTDSLYFPSLPLRASVPSLAVYQVTDDGEADLVQYRLPVPLLSGNRYTAAGSLSVATPEQLRAAPSDLPAWVIERYLRIPDAVPERVRNLAENLTDLMPTAYDKAVAIESWLRANIEYDEQLEAPPQGMEASDYILFQTKRAYCDYYATAMVVMLRSVGVPARVAAGYAQGEPVQMAGETVRYAVKVKDGHAWVEVFFPRYGWVEFEPTAGQPPLHRQEGSAALLVPPPAPATPTPTSPTPAPPTPAPPTPTPLPSALAEEEPPPAGAALQATAQALSPWLAVLPWLALIGGMIGLAWLGLRIAEGAGFGKLPPVQRFYAMLSRWATWLGIGGANTPYEQADMLAQRAPRADRPARRITELYVEQRFSPHLAAPEQDDEAQAAWENARAVLRQAWLTSRLRKLLGRE